VLIVLSSGIKKFKNKAIKDNIIDPNIPDKRRFLILFSTFLNKNKPQDIM
jgi:hypothetical protein